jgi:hypothetical protein
MAAIIIVAAMDTGRRLMAATLRRMGDQGESGLDPLAERGARRAVIHFWGRLHGFAQLGCRIEGGLLWVATTQF